MGKCYPQEKSVPHCRWMTHVCRAKTSRVTMLQHFHSSETKLTLYSTLKAKTVFSPSITPLPASRLSLRPPLSPHLWRSAWKSRDGLLEILQECLYKWWHFEFSINGCHSVNWSRSIWCMGKGQWKGGRRKGQEEKAPRKTTNMPCQRGEMFLIRHRC